MFSGALIEVAKDILIVGGAVCVIMLFFVLMWCLVTLFRVSRLVKSVKDSWMRMAAFTGIPLLVIQNLVQRLFVEDEDEKSGKSSGGKSSDDKESS